MKLMRQKSREYNGKEYYKYSVIIPSRIVEKLGWKTGQKLKAEAERGKLVVGKE